MRLILAYIDAVLRGYGQLFLCNNPVCGLFFLLGLLLSSPENAAWSVMGASLATLGAFLFGMKAESSSGLFGVNGALLGYACLYFPEVDATAKAGFTLFGSVVIVAILIPSFRWMHRRKSGITLFAIPALLAFGLKVGLLIGFGFIDWNLHRGWGALSNGKPIEAKQFFEMVSSDHSQTQSHRSDGLGWAEYRLQNYNDAREHFLQSNLGDGYGGAGWCSLQLREYERAIGEFERALDRDSGNADAWEGLGWANARTDQTVAAEECFRRAIRLTPLRADTYRGLSWNQSASRIEANVSRRWQYVTSVQWISWLLALLGIAYHSRVSLLIALIFVAGIAAFGGLSDPALLYNLVPLVLALGGQYLKLCRTSMLWLLATSLLLAFLWTTISKLANDLGCPLLCLPFHVLFIPTLLLFQYLERRRIVSISVPIGIATTTPAQVSLWFQKNEIASDCWERLSQAGFGSSLGKRSNR